MARKSRTIVSILTVACAAFLVVAATGCGGGGESASTTETESVDSTDAAGIEETDDMGTDADDADDMSTDDMGTDDDMTTDDDMEDATASSDDMDFGDMASSEDCQELGQLSARMSEAFGGTAGSDMGAYGEFLDEFAERTPEDIRDDFQVLADAYTTMAEAMEGIDLSGGTPPTAEQLARIQQMSQEVDQTALATASTNISAWVTENCIPG